MITLYNFGPNFGMPDPSPFCMKAMVLLKMAGLSYETQDCDPRKAPKGKGPYIVDDGVAVPDTTFIRWHLEKKYGIDFDKGLSPADRGAAWAFEKLCEDNLYWALIHERWMIEENFRNGPLVFFAPIPQPMRSLVVAMVKRQIKRDIKGQGFGRHSRDEIVELAKHGTDAISDFLGEKPFLMGHEPCGADASVFGTIANFLSPHFESETFANTKARANLVAYSERCMARWFPDFKA